MLKTYPSLVAKTWPCESLMWMMSKEPGCFSLQDNRLGITEQTVNFRQQQSVCEQLEGSIIVIRNW